jgi:hypothetical protein
LSRDFSRLSQSSRDPSAPARFPLGHPRVRNTIGTPRIPSDPPSHHVGCCLVYLGHVLAPCTLDLTLYTRCCSLLSPLVSESSPHRFPLRFPSLPARLRSSRPEIFATHAYTLGATSAKPRHPRYVAQGLGTRPLDSSSGLVLEAKYAKRCPYGSKAWMLVADQFLGLNPRRDQHQDSTSHLRPLRLLRCAFSPSTYSIYV